MGRPNKPSDYKAAIAALREKHADKIEDLFLKIYQYAVDRGDDGLTLGVDPKDSINAAKVVVSLLGVPRTATEKAPVKPLEEFKDEKPTLSREHTKVLDDILGKL
jgi:hypothetical protein